MNGEILLRFDDNLNVDDISKLLSAEGIEVSHQNIGRNMDMLASTIVVTGANVLIAVLNVVFSYLQARRSGKIVIHSVDGWRVEVKYGTSKQELKELIKLASTKTVHQIAVMDIMPNETDASNF